MNMFAVVRSVGNISPLFLQPLSLKRWFIINEDVLEVATPVILIQT